MLEQNLVDEVLLLVYPVLLGWGTRFFLDQVAPHSLAFVRSQATTTGVLINTYQPVGALPR